jgi:alpha-L-arabinofuranosidase
VGFGEKEYAQILRETLKMEDLITTHSSIMDKYDPQKKVALVVDEWGRLRVGEIQIVLVQIEHQLHRAARHDPHFPMLRGVAGIPESLDEFGERLTWRLE